MDYILRNYIYLDEDVIQGLYNQIFDNIIDETISTQNNFKGDISGGIEASGITKAVIDAGSNVGAEYTVQKTNEKQYQISVEKKTNLLISKISNGAPQKISDILDGKHPLKESIIFVGKALFTLISVYNQDGENTDLRNSLISYYDRNPSILLETGTTFHIGEYSIDYPDDDEYHDLREFENMKYGVIMNLGEKKIRQSIRHLTFNIKLGKKFLLNVFGEIYYDSGKYYIVKPFAIWR